MANNLLTQILVPKKRPNPQGTAFTSTFRPSGTGSILARPDFKSHMKDIFNDRTVNDSKQIIHDLLKYDSDVSATLHAFLTIADTEMVTCVYDENGLLDRDGHQQFEQLRNTMFVRNDYTTGYAFCKSLREHSEDLRYMTLARGGIAAELVFNKLLIPTEIRQIDISTLEWFEIAPGTYKPQQRPPGTGQPIQLDIASFFVKYYRQNPMDIYPESIFVSSINTIASRQQVINDLYRIMQKIGYPRIEATVVEEVLRKNAPPEMKASEDAMQKWLSARLGDIANDLSDMRADSAWVHFDAVEATILNDKGAAAALNVTDIISVLNAQNQAALKTMASVIGRGESGVNTASVEARMFSKSADSLNGPIADFYSDIFTLAMRMQGYQGNVVCYFAPVELRPDMELEPQKIVKQSRLLQALSVGVLTDDEFHIQMYNRPRPDSAPELSGTNFMAAAPAGGAAGGDMAGKISPNSDPLGRSVTPQGSKVAKSNTVKSGPSPKPASGGGGSSSKTPATKTDPQVAM